MVVAPFAVAHTLASFNAMDFSHKDESSLYAFDGDAKDVPILSEAATVAFQPFNITMGPRVKKPVDYDPQKSAQHARSAKSTTKGVVKVSPCCRGSDAVRATTTALLCRCPRCLITSFMTRTALRSSWASRTRRTLRSETFKRRRG